ncbi:putative Nucleolar protein Dnt1-like N-terminal domain-containing protein [Seiridium unicorne]|uniref:Nucleolar protein Dnt1-like N-terminal domain-containing protein n=1 Tax=Seiridium unicorne TaxID=138068 RepID=A0ABR2UZ98_9PEZI
MARSHQLKSKDISVRVQIFPHAFFEEKTMNPLKAFRLRMKEDATFAELANIALARYAKEDPDVVIEAETSSIIDEKDCAVDMDDEVDIIQQGEVLKLVLAFGRKHTTSSTPSKTTLAVTAGLRSVTPSVKNIRALTPAVRSFTAPHASQPPQSSSRIMPQTEPDPRKVLHSSATNPDSVQSSGGKGCKQDPYEIPSDSEDRVEKTNSRPPIHKKFLYGAENTTLNSQTRKPNPPATPKLTAPTSTRAISPNVEIISIDDSTPSSDDTDNSMLSHDTIMQRRKEGMIANASRQGRPAHGKRSDSHTINNHLKIVEERKDYRPGLQASGPAYLVKTSQGAVPVFLKKGMPSGSSNSSKSTTSSISIEHLNLTPSRVANSVENLTGKLQCESEDGEAARRQAEAQIKLPSAAIAHVKKITKARFVAKKSKSQIPSSFFAEPEHSDEDLGDIITGTQVSAVRTDAFDQEGCRAPPYSNATQRSQSTPKIISPTTTFKPINKLWPPRNPLPKAQVPKTIGAGYSQRVRDAFSCSDNSDTSNSDMENSDDELDHQTVEERDAGTPEPFRRWLTNYEVHFTPHLGFCSVADGPFKGLIRSGPKKGKYLEGHDSPTKEKIAKMEKTAIRKEAQALISDEDSSGSHGEGSDTGSEDDLEELPIAVPQSVKTTSSARSDAPSNLTPKQLSHEAPPSNQELGISMSSSPYNNTARSVETPTYRRPARLTSKRTADVADHRPEPVPVTFAQLTNQDRSVREKTPERIIKSYHYDADLEVTPNFERALSQVETPSTRSRSRRESPVEAKNDHEGRQSSSSNFVVKIPAMSAAKQAEYQKFPLAFEKSLLTAPLKSFHEINRNHEEAIQISHQSDAAAIEYVLKDSPAWLTSITEVDLQKSSTPKKAALLSNRRAIGSFGKVAIDTYGKRKNNDPKDLDPTYESSGHRGSSNRAADSDDDGRRKLPEKHVAPLSQGSYQKIGSSSQILSKVSTSKSDRLSTVAKKSLQPPATELNRTSSAPIPGPSIPDLFQRIKEIPAASYSQNALDARELEKVSANPETQSDSLHMAQGPPSTLANSTSLAPAVFETGHIGRDLKSHSRQSKRKHSDEDDVDAINPGNYPLWKRHKPIERRKSRKLNRELARQNTTNETIPATLSGPRQILTLPAIKKMGLTLMSKQKRKAFKRQVKDVKPSGYGQSPGLPPTKVELENFVGHTAQKLDDSLPAVAKMKGSDRNEHRSKSAKRRLPSPPTTSRPSSAGSKV